MPSLRARTLRLAAAHPPGSPLRTALTENVKTAYDHSSLDGAATDFLYEQAREAGFTADDVSSPKAGVYVITVADDVENPDEPGDYQSIQYRIVLSFLTGTAQVVAGKKVLYKERVSLDKLWGQGLGPMLMKLSRHGPRPNFQTEDSPSLQESMPWAYNER